LFESKSRVWYHGWAMAKSVKKRTKRAHTTAAGITNYSSAVRFLLDQTDFERIRVLRYRDDMFKLDRMHELLEKLNNPHQQIRMVHVAGTVGKGSTVAMIASMLQGCGYAVGQYVSPHLMDIRERISINNEMISRPDFTDTMRRVAEAADTLDEPPTFFELITAVAFLHFAEQAVDLAVIETGLGGRLDSTNVIMPEVCVITQIDRDHEQLLGRSLESIAGEKAGIMKKGVPTITCIQDEAVMPVLRSRAEEVDTTLKVVGEELEFSSRFGGSETRVCLVSETSQLMHLPVPLPGEHQAVNCGLALATIDLLKNAGFDCPEANVLEGLASTSLPGRMELVWDQPRILVDGAHNSAALSALMRCVGVHVAYDSMVCVFGCCEDKDIPAMLEKVALGGDKVIFTKARGNPRAADPDELQHEFQEISGKMSQVAYSIKDALQLASRAVGRDDLICVTGSFYLVGETKKFLQELARKKEQEAAM
jgi:dihydrofolate synthase/folylpolyglutamate synthase